MCSPSFIVVLPDAHVTYRCTPCSSSLPNESGGVKVEAGRPRRPVGRPGTLPPMSADAGQPLVNILGERIALGPLRRDLVPVYCRWMNDFNTLRTLGVLPVPTLLEEEEKWYERQVGGGGDTVHFTIYVRDGWRPVGNTSLMEI